MQEWTMNIFCRIILYVLGSREWSDNGFFVFHNVGFEGFYLKYGSCFWYCQYTTGDIQPWYVLWTYYMLWSGKFSWKQLRFLSRCQPKHLLTSRFVRMNWGSKYTMLILLLILATSTWGLSKLWDGGVRPPSPSQHTKNQSPYLLSPITSRGLILLSFRAPTVPNAPLASATGK